MTLTKDIDLQHLVPEYKELLTFEISPCKKLLYVGGQLKKNSRSKYCNLLIINIETNTILSKQIQKTQNLWINL